MKKAKIKCIQIELGRDKLTLFGDCVIVCIENSRGPTDKLLKQIRGFIRFAG